MATPYLWNDSIAPLASIAKGGNCGIYRWEVLNRYPRGFVRTSFLGLLLKRSSEPNMFRRSHF